MHYYGYGMDVFGFIGGIFMLILWIIIIAAILWTVREYIHYDRMRWKNGYKDNKALDLLKERYVKGEIDKAEYEEKKKDLSS